MKNIQISFSYLCFLEKPMYTKQNHAYILQDAINQHPEMVIWSKESERFSLQSETTGHKVTFAFYEAIDENLSGYKLISFTDEICGYMGSCAPTRKSEQVILDWVTQTKISRQLSIF